MTRWSPRWTLLAGLGLIGVINALALGGVAYNRSGEPESVLRLSERELHRPWNWRGSAEDSGLALRLQWRVPNAERDPPDVATYYDPPGRYGMPAWLDRNKLAALGFDVSRPLSAEDGSGVFSRQLSREVLLVLEHDGPAYRRALERVQAHVERQAALAAANPGKAEFEQRAKSAREALGREESENSRLFVVDAGLDHAALRAAYPSRTQYAVVRGRIRPGIVGRGDKTEPGGYIQSLSIDEVNVPHDFRTVFDRAPRMGRGTPAGDPFEATVAFGSRLEPWITALAATTKTPR